MAPGGMTMPRRVDGTGRRSLDNLGPLHLLPGLAKVLRGAHPPWMGKGAGEAGWARLRVATTFARTLPQDSTHRMNSARVEPFGKAPAGALLGSIRFHVRRCQAVADVGVIDRSSTGNPMRGIQHGLAV